MIAYSRGSEKYDGDPEQRVAETFEDFADAVLSDRAPRGGLQYICAPLGGNGHKCKENALPRNWLPLDVDHIADLESLHDLVAYAQRWLAFGHTTKRHTPKKPRVRLVVALSRPVDAVEMEHCGRVIEARIHRDVGLGRFGFDKSVYLASQAIYTPLVTSQCWRMDGTELDVEQLLAEEVSNGTNASKPASTGATQTATEEQIRHLRSALNWLDADDRELWVAVGHALKPLGNIGRALWFEWSQRSDKHDPRADAKTWDSFKPSHTGFQAIFAKAQAVGWPNPKARDDDSEDEAEDEGQGDPAAPRRHLVGKDDHEFAATLFSVQHPDWRYTAAFGAWRFYDPEAAIWRDDEKLAHLTLVRQLVRKDCPRKMRRASEIAGIARLAGSNAAAAMAASEWDADPWLLGTPGAVVDLRSGEAIADPKAAYTTRQTSVPLAPPGTRAPIWEAFLARITRHDPSLPAYLQTIAGYALTGSDREQALFFAYGGGGNGKSVMFNALHAVMGSYAHVANNDLLLSSSGDRHPADMAMLHGARLVTASELRPGARWDEQRLKGLTGGDPITARKMRQDFFTFRPQFTLIVFGNHRPSFAGVDEAIRRRVRLIPFTQTIPEHERDPQLPDKLRAEYPAILRWMLEGALIWQRDGLKTPASVREASAAYLEAEDLLGQYIADRLHRQPPSLRAFVSRRALFIDWSQWAAENGGPDWTAKALYAALSERGIAEHKRDGERGFRDIELVRQSPGAGWQRGVA